LVLRFSLFRSRRPWILPMPALSFCICATLDDQVSSLISFYPSRKAGFFNSLTENTKKFLFSPDIWGNKSTQVSNRTLSQQTALIAATKQTISGTVRYKTAGSCRSGNAIRATPPVFPFA
jgi:hypothetical protein